MSPRRAPGATRAPRAPHGPSAREERPGGPETSQAGHGQKRAYSNSTKASIVARPRPNAQGAGSRGPLQHSMGGRRRRALSISISTNKTTRGRLQAIHPSLLARIRPLAAASEQFSFCSRHIFGSILRDPRAVRYVAVPSIAQLIRLRTGSAMSVPSVLYARAWKPPPGAMITALSAPCAMKGTSVGTVTLEHPVALAKPFSHTSGPTSGTLPG